LPKPRQSGRPFACSWCGDRFRRKPDLNEHWLATPICARNRLVNDPTQAKGNVTSQEFTAIYTPEDGVPQVLTFRPTGE
jgi:hypothetical protein